MLRSLLPLSLATGLLTLTGVVGAPAHADEEATSPAGGMVLPGEDLEDESSDLGAPVEVTAGTWRGELGEGGTAEATRYFAYDRVTPRSTVIFSVTSPGGGQLSADGISIAAIDEAGEDCTFSTVDSTRTDTETTPLSASLALGVQEAVAGEEEYKCLADDRLILQIDRSEDASGTAPYALRVVEESPLASADGLPAPLEELPEPQAPAVDGDAQDVSGAPGLEDAPEVRDGIYRQSGRSDRTTYYRVPDVQWGQSVRAAVVVQPSTALDDFETGPDVTVTVLSPMADNITDGSTAVSGSEPERVVVDTGPVRYRNRLSEGFDPLAWTPGDHVLQVTVEPAEGEEMDVDLTLQVQVAGEEDDAPDFTESDAYLVADGDRQPVITAWGVSAFDRVLGGLATVVRYAGAGLLAVLGLVALAMGVRTLRATPAARAA